MKRLLLVALSILFLQVAQAQQQTADIGLWGGLGTYSGDMTLVETKSSLGPAGGIFLRYNFNPRYSIRGTLMLERIKATGEFESSPWEFSKTVTDVSGMFEFNFFKYIIGSSKYSITTYLIGGLGVSFYPYEFDPVALNAVGAYVDPAGDDKNVAALNMPFGFGFKFNIGERWSVGLESQFRKYFDDKLDNLDDPKAFVNPTTGVLTEYTSSLHNNDWTYHLGVHVCYRFYQGGKKCPAYDNIN
ncbi:type IX secretion system protein PorG [Mangrovibacterium diazotrophicum]|uniref:Outer membrane protein with beta-barrel domain n=1 Tax=Mangrovibacterium diazotrophicum TaxID=1261403 RepID=A0A419W521_9BACT|nr:DUF6089 family protein [Mangrovibacterium diazotrophicum]RKD90558.1 outer membrane protein with beta-barrel domain [Mangrovibacterium diazotrophicum]